MEKHDDLIELGAASTETQGPLIGVTDELGRQPAAGLNND